MIHAALPRHQDNQYYIILYYYKKIVSVFDKSFI
jgi:hypothetical protein